MRLPVVEAGGALGLHSLRPSAVRLARATVWLRRTAPSRVLLVLLTMTLVFVPRSSAAQPCGLCGDANGDQQVDIVDALFIAQLTVGLRTSVPCPVDADVNMSVGIDVIDALFIGQLTVGLRTTLACVPPFTIGIDSPTSLQLFGASPIAVTGTLSGLVTSVTCNGAVASLTPTSFSATVQITEGNTAIACVAADGTGRTVTASVTVELDTTPPRVVIDAPSDGASVSTAHVVVTGTVNDIVVGTVNGPQAQVSCNGLMAQVANRTFVVANVPLNVGLNTITCTATDRVGNLGSGSVTVTFDTTPRARISAISGDLQSATIGTPLPAALVVSLTDDLAQPVAGKKVIFEVTQNDGRLDGGTTSGRAVALDTDTNGRALVMYTLGTRTGFGNNQVRASAVGFAGEAVFCASALPDAPANILADSGTNQRGAVRQPLPRPFVAIVIDRGNNRLANVPVTFTMRDGDGHFAGQPSVTANTDSDGSASAVLTLGPPEGFDNNVVEATFPGNTGTPAVFVASGQLPGDPAATQVSGVVLDNSDVPVPGASVIIANTTLSTMSDAQGQFRIAAAPVGRVLLLVDGSTVQRPGTWPNLEFEMVTVPGQDNTIGRGPIYLLPLEVPGQPPGQNKVCVDQTTGGTITLPDMPGMSLTILPGSATFPNGLKTGCVSVTPVHADKAPMVPTFGAQPRILLTIQPAGTRFDPPAPIAYPNAEGLAPGQKMDLYSFDHDLFQFVSIGTGTVSEDATVIRSDPGLGIVKAGWNWGSPPLPFGTCSHDCDDHDDCTLDISVAGGRTCRFPQAPDNTPCHWPGVDYSFESFGVNVTLEDSCRGICFDGACAVPLNDPFIPSLRAAVPDALGKIFDSCLPSDLKGQMIFHLLSFGLRIQCPDNPDLNGDGNVNECAVAPVGSNAVLVNRLATAGTPTNPYCIDAMGIGHCCGTADSIIRHELQHSAGNQRHLFLADGKTVDCSRDPVYACDQLCFGANACGNSQQISNATAAANCR